MKQAPVRDYGTSAPNRIMKSSDWSRRTCSSRYPSEASTCRTYTSAGRISFTARRKPPRTVSIVSEVIGVEVHIIRRGAA